MDFTLSKEHEMARKLFHDFAENEVKPLAQEVDETEHFPEETVKKMQKLGFMGIPVPKEYGGQGCDPLTYAMCVEELPKFVVLPALSYLHTHLCAAIRSRLSVLKSRNRNTWFRLLRARSLVLSVLLSRVLVQMLRVSRPRLY